MTTMISGRRCAWLMLAAACLAMLLVAPVRADFLGEGDVAPGTVVTGPPDVWVSLIGFIDGGDVGADVIVGGTGIPETGTTVGRVVLDLPALTDPVTSTSLFIGGAEETVGFDGIGEVVVTGGLGSNWTVEEFLITGVSGIGYLTVSNGGLVESDPDAASSITEPDAAVGQFFGSQGFVTVSGFGTRLSNTNFVVGDEGFGRVEVTTRARIVTRDEAVIGDEAENFPGDGTLGVGYVLLDGQGTRWNIGDVDPNGTGSGTGNLTVGREGRGGLEIRNRALVMVEVDTLIGSQVQGGVESFGQVFVNGQDSLLWNLSDIFVGSASSSAPGELHVEDAGVARADSSVAVSSRGLVVLAGGTVLTPSLTSGGVIRGFGRIEASVVNNGFIRNAASTANLREYLKITGTVMNNADIESVGGEMEFEREVSNVGPDGDIVGIDAIFRFNGGLVNTGNVFLDNTLVWTPGTFMSEAALVVAAGPNSTLVGDLELGAANTLFVDVGSQFSRLEMTGDAVIDGILDIALGDGYTPRVGDSFEILEAASVMGTFSGVVAPSLTGITFDVSYFPDSVLITIDAGFVFNADWDMDGTVTGLDLAIWRTNFGMMVAPGTLGDANGDGLVDGADFNIWQRQLGTMPATPVAGAVPEPASAMLLAMAALAFTGRRRVK